MGAAAAVDAQTCVVLCSLVLCSTRAPLSPLSPQFIGLLPLYRYKGITLYQTDWALSSLYVRVADADGAEDDMSQAQGLQLPMASLEGKNGLTGPIWGTFLPTGPPLVEGGQPQGFSLLARDPQSVVVYDSAGTFVGVRRPGSGKPLVVEGRRIVIDALVGSTGMEIKSDPGVPWVYAGFGLLMVTTFVSFISHSQVRPQERLAVDAADATTTAPVPPPAACCHHPPAADPLTAAAPFAYERRINAPPSCHCLPPNTRCGRCRKAATYMSPARPAR